MTIEDDSNDFGQKDFAKREREWQDRVNAMLRGKPSGPPDTGADGFYAGLDIGQKRDHPALAIVERTGERLALRYIHQCPLQMLFRDLADDVARRLRQVRPVPRLLVDATGVGGPVIEFLEEAGLNPVAVTLTAGESPRQVTKNLWHVPQRVLIQGLDVALQTRRLSIPRTLPEREALAAELAAIRARISQSGRDSYGSRTESDHDDMVFALSYAVWGADALKPRQFHVVTGTRRW